MYKSQDVVSEAQEPLIGGSDNAAKSGWLPHPTAREEVYRIIKEVAAEAGTFVTVGDVLGQSRIKHVVDVRHRAIARVHLHLPWMSYPVMGRVFGGRDHSTILHALRKMGVLQKRRRGGGGGGHSLAARLYGHHMDHLFVRIGAALSVSAIPTEGANPHETA